MSGVLSSTLWQGKLEAVDFYTIKGVLNSVLNSININLDYEKIDVEMNEMHPLRTAKLTYNNKVVGFIGMLHPKYAQVNSLQNVYVAEVNIHDLIRDEKEIKHYVPVSKVPSVERDLAIVVKKDISSGDLVNTIYNVDKKDINIVIDKINNLVSEINKLGFNVKLDKYDFDELYQFVIKIDKE